MSQRDIKIPADASDQQTTDARSALPPAEFSLAHGTTANVLSIQDRQGPQSRVSTSAYRIYFLPKEYSPDGATSSITSSIVRLAARNVADLVAEVKAPALGTVLNVTDATYVNRSGYYYCVGVNRVGVEAPPEHIILTDPLSLEDTSTTGGGPVPPPPIVWLWLETTYGGAPTITGAVDGINVTFTMTQAFGIYDVVFVDGIIDLTATSLGLVLTTSTPPISGVTVEHLA